jgi:hypothetical protein
MLRFIHSRSRFATTAPASAIECYRDLAGWMIALALDFMATWIEDMPGRKVRTPQGAVVGNAHRPITRVGTVPQKRNRLGRPRAVAVRVKR